MKLSNLKTLRRTFLFLLFSPLLVVGQQTMINVNPDRQVAIHGYDTVAYFTKGEAIEGNENFKHEYQGASWLFASQQHLDLFKGNPEMYMPQYGGYCAYAASQGAKADIDPIAWRVIEDKLYLNYDLRVQKVWAESLQEYISTADQFWSTQ